MTIWRQTRTSSLDALQNCILLYIYNPRIEKIESWGHVLFYTDIEHQLLDVACCLGIRVEASQDVGDFRDCQAGRALPCDAPKIGSILNTLNSCGSICNTE